MLKTLTTMAALAAFTTSASATLFLSFEKVDLEGGYTQYTISARGNEGETVNTIQGLAAENGALVHHVGGLGFGGSVPTPTLEATKGTAAPFNADWLAYDSHALWANEDLVGAVGSALDETNDNSTRGTLGLSQAFGQDPFSGLGTFGQGADGAAAFVQAKAGGFVDVAQIVLAPGTQPLWVGATIFDSTGGSRYSHVQIPEPASIAMLGLGGLAMLRRRK